MGPSVGRRSVGSPRGRDRRRLVGRRLSRIAAGLPLLLVACGGAGESGSATAMVRDSAGVRIVEHEEVPTVDTVVDAPALEIGRMGEPAYEFFAVNAVLPLGTGEIVVGNAGTRELRFYAPDGEYLRTVGGQGEGPSELGFLGGARLAPGDTIVATDAGRRRALFFGPQGGFGRAVSFASDLQLEQPEGDWGQCTLPGLLGVLDDHTRVVSGWGCLAIEETEGPRDLHLRIHLVRDGSRDTVPVSVPGIRWERADAETSRSPLVPVPFGAQLSYAVSGDALYLSRGVSYEVEVRRPGGEGLVAIYREGSRPPAVTAPDRRAYRAEREQAGMPHPDDVPFPERFGGYDRIVVAHEGDVWARRQGRPAEQGRRWTVFAADGGRVRHLRLPDVEVESVREGRVYGTRTDALDVETVVVYELPATGPR